MKTQGTPKQSAGQPKNAWPVLPLCLGIMTAISSPAYAENTPSHSSETPCIQYSSPVITLCTGGIC